MVAAGTLHLLKQRQPQYTARYRTPEPNEGVRGMTDIGNRALMILAAGVFWVFLNGPVHADDSKVNVNLRLFDALALFPGPSWVVTGKISEETKIYRKQKGPQFIFEFVPKGETFQRWTQLYAVYALYSDRISNKDFIRASLGGFAVACGRTNLSIEPAARLVNGAIIIIYCQNSPNGPIKLGYGDDVGEITVMRLQRVRNTHIKLYHHWRGKAFDKTDTSSWPASPDQIKDMVERLKQASFIATPAGNPPAGQPAPQIDR